jgi:N-acetyltransferase
VEQVAEKSIVVISRSQFESNNKDEVYSSIQSEANSRLESSECHSLGVRLIWVVKQARRNGLAAKLLDAARGRFLISSTVAKSDVVFSQPSDDGLAFAFAYTGGECLKVYK